MTLTKHPARACPGQRPNRPPTGRAPLAKVVTPPRVLVLDVPSQAVQSRPARFGRGPLLRLRARGGCYPGQIRGLRAKPCCRSEGPAPHTPRDIVEQKKTGGL